MRKEAKSLTYITIAFILISILSSLAIAKTTITKPIIFSLAILIPSVYLLIKFKRFYNFINSRKCRRIIRNGKSGLL